MTMVGGCGSLWGVVGGFYELCEVVQSCGRLVKTGGGWACKRLWESFRRHRETEGNCMMHDAVGRCGVWTQEGFERLWEAMGCSEGLLEAVTDERRDKEAETP